MRNIKNRNIAVCVILSFITCGIYPLIWFVNLTDEINSLAESNDTSGGMALLLTIVTCGFYGIYWAYKIGEKVDFLKSKRGINSSSNSILFLILQIFGLGLINFCLAQDEINNNVQF